MVRLKPQTSQSLNPHHKTSQADAGTDQEVEWQHKIRTQKRLHSFTQPASARSCRSGISLTKARCQVLLLVARIPKHEFLFETEAIQHQPSWRFATGRETERSMTNNPTDRCAPEVANQQTSTGPSDPDVIACFFAAIWRRSSNFHDSAHKVQHLLPSSCPKPISTHPHCCA